MVGSEYRLPVQPCYYLNKKMKRRFCLFLLKTSWVKVRGKMSLCPIPPSPPSSLSSSTPFLFLFFLIFVFSNRLPQQRTNKCRETCNDQTLNLEWCSPFSSSAFSPLHLSTDFSSNLQANTEAPWNLYWSDSESWMVLLFLLLRF